MLADILHPTFSGKAPASSSSSPKAQSQYVEAEYGGHRGVSAKDVRLARSHVLRPEKRIDSYYIWKVCKVQIKMSVSR